MSFAMERGPFNSVTSIRCQGEEVTLHVKVSRDLCVLVIKPTSMKQGLRSPRSH